MMRSNINRRVFCILYRLCNSCSCCYCLVHAGLLQARHAQSSSGCNSAASLLLSHVQAICSRQLVSSQEGP
jgi:hypothetical protein